MTEIKKKDRDAKKVYLCQVSETVSCGACCGLYNLADASRPTLVQLLSERTEIFSALPRDVEAILAFGRDMENRTADGRPLPDFHHCPYLGLIGPRKTRVGCLLHPQNPVNKGIDYRGLSYYGGLACAVYFCPASRLLSPVLMTLVQNTLDDWHLYGLVITEQKFLIGLFDRVETGLGRRLTEKDIHGNRGYRDALREVLSLKLDWPHRPGNTPGRCHYFFNDNLYPKPPVHYGNCRKTSPFHDLFHELVSRFDAPESLEAAENTLQVLIDRIVEAFRQ